MKLRGSIEIIAPPEKIWPLLVKPENILKWCITFKKCEYVSDQHSGVGTPFYVEEKAGGPLMKLNFAVNEWVENKKLARKMTSGNFVKGYEQNWTIESIPSGSRFNFAEDVRLPYGVIGTLLGLFARSGSETHLKKMLANLKGLAET